MSKEIKSLKDLYGEDYSLAMKFAEEIYPEFSSVIKSIIFFGSSSRKKSKSGDIDLLLIFNDSEVISNNDFKKYFNMKVEEVSNRVSSKLHINIVTLTVFFQNLINSEPVVLNVLRDGVALIDTGFFSPLKILLLKGDLKPTPEAIFNSASRVSHHLLKSKLNLLSSVQELYLSMLDASQAMLMSYGEVAPSPRQIPNLLASKKIKSDYVDFFIKMQKVFKKIEHRELNNFLGKDYDELLKYTLKFNKEMEKKLKKNL